MTVPTRADLFAAGERAITIRPSKITRETLRTPGSTARAIVQADAAMSEEVAVYAVQAFAETRLATAARIGGDVLDRRVFDMFGTDIEPRRTASLARTSLRLLRTVAGEGVTIPAGFRFGTADGIVFATISDAVFSSTSLGPVTVNAVCLVAGTAGNVGLGTVTSVLDQSPTEGLSVSNIEVGAGGEDSEGDEAFFARARRYWAGARRATPAAVELGVLSTPGVAQAVLTELLDPEIFVPLFRARVVIAGANGASNRAVGELVRERLEEYRPLGCPVTVIAGQPVEIAIRFVGVTFAAGANTSQVRDQIRLAVASAVNQTGPGETLYRKTIWSAVERFKSVATIPESALVEPAGDLSAPTPQSVIRTTATLVEI
jgi:uncharacterized phage protein gp47/JayE